MWPDRVSNPEPLALEIDALPTELRGPAATEKKNFLIKDLSELTFNTVLGVDQGYHLCHIY